MRIWRVAKPAGDGFPRGPYSGHEVRSRELDAMNEAHCDGTNHPTPSWDDALRWIAHSEYCAFSSSEALYVWFEAEWLPALRADGFRVYVYDVPDEDVRVGSKAGQVVFKAAQAQLIETQELEIANA